MKNFVVNIFEEYKQDLYSLQKQTKLLFKSSFLIYVNFISTTQIYFYH